MNRFLALSLSIMLLPVIAFAEIMPSDVVEKMRAGDIQTAEEFTREIIKNHPNSAKAHYYLGQILAQKGKYKPAYAELNKAADLDKTLTFAATPERFRQEMDKVKINLGRAEAPPISNVKDSGWGLFTWLLILSGFGGIIWFFFFMEQKKTEGKKEKNPAANHPAYASSAPKDSSKPATPSSYRPASGTPYQSSYPQQPQVVNNYNSGNGGLVEGMILGSMLAGGHSTNTTIIEKETTNNNIVQNDNFDAGNSNSSSSENFDSGSNDASGSVFDSGSSDSFDSGGDSSSFDSGSSGFDSGSSGGDW